MLKRWLDAWRARRAQRVLNKRAIPDELWLETLRAYPFLKRRPLQDLLSLRELATLFLSEKEFSTAGELELTDAMAVAVAAQACVPVLHLPGGLSLYGGFVGIVLHPQEVVVQRRWSDEAGVVHSGDEVLAGEAMEGGPVMLSWQDVQMAGEPDRAEDGYNVVIHEFIHVLDMRHGGIDGMPALPNRAMRERWLDVMARALAQHTAEVAAEQPTWLDPYAAQGPEEFFPVTAEAFFVAPDGLHAEFPEVYALLHQYFEQDPIRFLH
ncbi:zinc-dependent peptidase [Sphaerotilus sp.]|uniref:M90 family metallopeptidase n=1 Tax=Sphaerotilus sp. TaxID=2093942 RepID=UPI0034E2480A